MSHKDGIKLNSGKVVSGKDIPYLDPDEIKELIESPSTQWDYLILRNLLHALRNDLQGVVNHGSHDQEQLLSKLTGLEKQIETRFSNLDKEFNLEVGNGKKIRRRLSSIVSELYDDHYAIRMRKRKLAMLKDNKNIFIIILLALFGLSVFFHDEVNNVFHLIEREIEIMIGAGLLVPALIAFLRWIFSKKRD